MSLHLWLLVPLTIYAGFFLLSLRFGKDATLDVLVKIDKKIDLILKKL